jgi:tripartite-type tricarboxylate transporter receptor subunit TctC
MNRLIRCLALASLCALTVAPAAAQVSADPKTFPNRTIRIVVPFPAGGPTDVLTRVIAQKMSESWGQPVVVENRPGADTAIGAVQVAKAAPDGYTLLAAMDTTLVMNPATKASLPYDPFKDYAMVSMVSKNTSLLTVRAADGP